MDYISSSANIFGNIAGNGDERFYPKEWEKMAILIAAIQECVG